jgi:hypothetical protein
MTMAGWICGIVGTILSALTVLVMCAIAAFYAVVFIVAISAAPTPAPAPPPPRGGGGFLFP